MWNGATTSKLNHHSINGTLREINRPAMNIHFMEQMIAIFDNEKGHHNARGRLPMPGYFEKKPSPTQLRTRTVPQGITNPRAG
jgi:hypothetical protein